MFLVFTTKKLSNLMSNERGLLYSHLNSESYKFYFAEDNINLDVQLELDRLKNDGLTIKGLLLEEYSWIRKLNVNWSFKFPKDIDIPIFSFISDYWLYTREFRHFIEANQIDILISMHQNSYGFIKKYISPTVVIKYLPFCVDTTRFSNEVKDIGVFNPNQIDDLNPLRNEIIKALDTDVKNNLQGKVKYNRMDLEHPGKRKSKVSNKLTDVYGSLMSRSYFTVTCTNRFNISIRKYQEIACSGGIILGNLTELPEHDHFRTITHFVSMSNVNRRLADLDLPRRYDVDIYRRYYSPTNIASMLENIMTDSNTLDEYRIAKAGRLFDYLSGFPTRTKLRLRLFNAFIRCAQYVSKV
jgi:hypothetical protein